MRFKVELADGVYDYLRHDCSVADVDDFFQKKSSWNRTRSGTPSCTWMNGKGSERSGDFASAEASCESLSST